MAIDLYGDKCVNGWEYARKIVTKGANLPFYKLIVIPGLFSTTVDLQSEDYKFVPREKLYVPGFYAVYRRTLKTTECLYVGYSAADMHHRLYRFGKEFLDRSREDEDHPAARKIRNAGIPMHELYVKFMPKTDFPECKNARFDLNTLDETLAILLKSRFNERKKY